MKTYKGIRDDFDEVIRLRYEAEKLEDLMLEKFSVLPKEDKSILTKYFKERADYLDDHFMMERLKEYGVKNDGL